MGCFRASTVGIAFGQPISMTAYDVGLVAGLADATGDLASADLQATAGNLSRTIYAGAAAGDFAEVETIFSLPEGDCDLVMKATDAAAGSPTRPWSWSGAVRPSCSGSGRPAGASAPTR